MIYATAIGYVPLPRLLPESWTGTHDDAKDAPGGGDDTNNVTLWLGQLLSYLLQWSAPSEQLHEPDHAGMGGLDEDRAEWFRFARPSRNRWLRENPY